MLQSRIEKRLTVSFISGKAKWSIKQKTTLLPQENKGIKGETRAIERSVALFATMLHFAKGEAKGGTMDTKQSGVHFDSYSTSQQVRREDGGGNRIGTRRDPYLAILSSRFHARRMAR